MKKLLLTGGGHNHVEVMRPFGLRSAADISVTVFMAEKAARLVYEIFAEKNGVRICLFHYLTWPQRLKRVFGIDV